LLYLGGARDYDPVVGRWLQRDPIKFQGGTTNLYEYCGNDSVNCIDPKGLAPNGVCLLYYVVGVGALGGIYSGGSIKGIIVSIIAGGVLGVLICPEEQKQPEKCEKPIKPFIPIELNPDTGEPYE
jgi:hypothetical protein